MLLTPGVGDGAAFATRRKPGIRFRAVLLNGRGVALSRQDVKLALAHRQVLAAMEEDSRVKADAIDPGPVA